MSGKNANARLHTDLERYREEGNWKKVIQLAEQLKSQNISKQDSHLATLLLGEGKLESYLEEHPPLQTNVSHAKTGLNEARTLFNSCVGDQAKKMPVSLDALLLLAKLEYATGDYNAALTKLNNAGIDKLQEKNLNIRSLKIIAESFAIKGLCLEQTTLNRSSRYKKEDKLAKTIRCFEVAGDLTLLYLQKMENIQSTPSTSSLPSLSASTNTGGSSSPLPPYSSDIPDTARKVGVILEASLLRAPALLLKAGNVAQAVDRYRMLLTAQECNGSQHLRLTVSTQLAEVLMRSVCSTTYQPPDLPPVTDSKDKKAGVGNSSSGNNISNSSSFSEGAWKPRRYGGVNVNLFVPNTRTEEIILLLLISEAMAVKDAVLTQTPEFKEMRIKANTAATAIHDILAIALANTRQYQMLIEVYERSMKFSWSCSHVWRQFSLALMCGRQPLRSLKIMSEANRLQPTNPLNCLLAAKVAMQSLGQVDEGLEWVKKAEDAIEKPNTAPTQNSDASNPLLSNSMLSARCLLFRGIGLLLKAHHSHVFSASLSLRNKAMASLLKSSDLDPCEHLTHLYLSECYASYRQLPEAMHHIRTALQLRPDHLCSLLMLVLLLQAQGQVTEAIQLTERVQKEHPYSLQVINVLVALMESHQGAEAALQPATKMMSLWHGLYSAHLSGDNLDSAEVASGHTTLHHDAHSVFNMSEDNDNVSVNAAASTAGIESVSRVEFALSEVASSVSGSQCAPKHAPHHAWAHQIHCWLTISRLYLSLDQTAEAMQCIQEASTLFPMSHQIMFMRGQVYDHKGQLFEAQTCYENALAVNPHHTSSLRHLGTVYHQQGYRRLAEKTLLDAVKIDPLDHHSWFTLGEITRDIGELDRSSECLLTAIELEKTAPVMPFSALVPVFS